jgi:hypothetical protein
VARTIDGVSRRPDDGAAWPLVLAVVAVAALAVVGVGRLAGDATDAARARTAADAVALGVLVGADPGVLAARNGAQVVGLERRGDTVTVTVVVGATRATARAELVWRPRE